MSTSDQTTSPEQLRLMAMGRLMSHVTLAVMFVIPLFYMLVWLGGLGVRDVMGIDEARAFITSPETGSTQRLAGFALSMVPQLALLYGLARLRRLFAGFAGGNAFEEQAAGHMKGFAYALLGFALLDFIMEIPMSAFLTWQNPPGERLITISLGWDDFQTYFLIVLFFALTRVMAEGVRLARENAEFV